MSAHTIVTETEVTPSFATNGIKIVSGTFTGSASYDTGGSVLDMSDSYADECRELTATDESGTYMAVYDNAASNAPATGKVIVKQVLPTVATVTIAHDGTLFDATATTDNAVVWAQPAGSTLVGVGVKVGAQFVAASMSALAIEIGDSGDNNGVYAGAADLVADAVNSVTYTRGAYLIGHAGYSVVAATNWTAYVSATGANLDATSAGSLVLYFYYYPAPASSKWISGPGAEVASTTDLSGVTFKFLSNGTDA